MEAASVDWGLTGKAVIVTGASSGIGASTARALGAAGASVLLVGRDVNRLSEQARATQAAGGRAEIASIDLDDIDATAGLPERAVARIRVAPRDRPHRQPLRSAGRSPTPRSSRMEQQWRTNVAAPLMLTKAAVPHLGAGSSVVFIGSTTGTMGFPGCSAYTATKGAVDSVTRALAVEFAASGIRFNLVVPGYVRTPMLQPHLDANEGYEQWILERTPAGAHRRARTRSRRASSSCSPPCRSTSTAPRSSPMVAGSPSRAGRAGADNRSPGTAGATSEMERRGRPLARARAALLGDLDRDGRAVRRQPTARERQRQPQRVALDAAVRGHPRDRRDRADARHPAARPRSDRGGDDHAVVDPRDADPGRARRPAAQGHRRRSSSSASPPGWSAASQSRGSRSRRSSPRSASTRC